MVNMMAKVDFDLISLFYGLIISKPFPMINGYRFRLGTEVFYKLSHRNSNNQKNSTQKLLHCKVHIDFDY